MDEYERRLARYEAAEKACAQEALDDGGAMDFYSPFGPLIARVQAPMSLVDSINSYMDRKIEAHEGPGGAQSEADLLGGTQRFSKSLISFKPAVGDFYIFPGWLLHAVEPFGGVGERRSMSFNAFVE
jgi:hypothetical protein